MTDRSPWLVALSTANLLFLVAAAFLVRGRLESVDARLESLEHRAATTPKPKPERPDAGASGDLATRLQKLSDDAYTYYSELASDLHETKRTVKTIHATTKRIQQQLAAPGSPVGSWSLLPVGTPTAEGLAAYQRDAANAGVKVLPGRVEVRGFLNMSPWTTMPIEYFVTRFPVSGHETLLHVVGPATLDRLEESDLKGLVTAIYKGFVAAGFQQGSPSRLDPPAPGDKEQRPRWVAPTGDVVYVGVRYMLGGKLHVARATDWVIDPSTRSVLPQDAFRFVGSQRDDDFETGDEMLTAEAGGLVVSVYGNPNALVEITLESNLQNRYQYHHARIPKPAVLVLADGRGHLEGTRDRARNALVLQALEKGGERRPIEKAPVLLGRGTDGAPVEVPFTKVASGWEVVHAALAKGEWKVRVETPDGPTESTGFEPLYVDLLFSKTPIEPEGDGAAPMAPIVLPEDLPAGTGTR